MAAIKVTQESEIQKIENKIRAEYQYIGYSKARIAASESKIKYWEGLLQKLKGKGA